MPPASATRALSGGPYEGAQKGPTVPVKSMDDKGRIHEYALTVIGLVLVLSVLVSSCGVVVGDPTDVVKRFWGALAENDQNTMLDCLEPDLRTGADPFGCILPGGDWAVILAKGLGLELTAAQYEVLDRAEDAASVQVTGRMRVPDGVPLLGGTVRQFEIRHKVVRRDRKWYLTCP
jgi:hypothetical protein